MMRTGQMRHQVVIQVRSTAQDTYGEQVQSWTEFATRRALVERSRGSEIWASAQRSGRVPVVFHLRYLDGVTPGMRVLFDGRVHNILSAIDQEGRGEELILTTEELVGEMP